MYYLPRFQDPHRHRPTPRFPLISGLEQEPPSSNSPVLPSHLALLLADCEKFHSFICLKYCQPHGLSLCPAVTSSPPH
ncbi:hypothetical protein PGTUg99_019070 [Puccinia graminis f. sp. tritici]|uniref:Uncharacterized protein n=1 Tax=Puccinia graminis f. sp. tritici TaxID=56615 RepID=A0A5B0SC13_PUCGR|nr:hypothetical protein PGTUg99_019070 [Puccinia graminis f. sp. tritici]